MTDLTDATLASLTALARAATAGPWKADDRFGCKGIRGAKAGPHRQAQYTEIAYTVGLVNEEHDAANAAYIAAANPETVLALVAALVAAREAIDKLTLDRDEWMERAMESSTRGNVYAETIAALRRENKALAALPQARAAEEGR